MKKLLIILLGLVFSNVATSTDLKMYVETSELGSIYIYIENIGSHNHLILTKKLAHVAFDIKTEISPKTYVWRRDNKTIILKESIEKYGPVLLKPGEITFISNQIINSESGTVTYKIRPAWAKLHGTWSGTLEAKY
ncbi:hypothetical protein [Colwellia sp. Bg11-28]|uniref:hypothetical protein n=1 Tax=Colwellia sp. Bg11-28 TaxID=2058305 RepID=UPI000C346AD6|nr:hypothetical protein [Colwellia sp. Bg11-28]PKH87705.1 hypothetical protein CXF79_13795 [Colwellia sp. Bg11-28]